MNELKNSIEVVLARIKKFSNLYEKNEEAVRNQIINPILRSLGWDPENPEAVQPNLHTDEGIPDYTLVKDKEKKVLVEAKNLGVDVEQTNIQNQLAKYAFGEGVEYGILTNGSV